MAQRRATRVPRRRVSSSRTRTATRSVVSRRSIRSPVEVRDHAAAIKNRSKARSRERAAASSRSTGKWLIKSDPGDYSFDDLQKDGSTTWDGVKNNLALVHLRRFSTGDEVLVYHTGGERAIMGLATVTKAPYPDPNAENPHLVANKRTIVRVIR